MQQNQPPRMQCFAKWNFSPVFSDENNPRLVYACDLPPNVLSSHLRAMHAHQDLTEVLLIYSGGGELLLGGRKHAICPGDLVIYNPGVVHDEWSWRENEVGHYCIGVNGLHMPGLRENALIPEEQNCVFSAGDSFEKLRTLFEMIYHSLLAGEPQAELFCDGLTRALLIKVLSVVNGAGASPIEPPDVLGKRIQDYIDTHYTEALTLQSIGDALHISPYYLSHVFKKEVGYSPMQYLLRRRIGEAQTLLLTTSLPVGQISEKVGYDTQSYFNQQFTKQMGMSPGRYRQVFTGSKRENRN